MMAPNDDRAAVTDGTSPSDSRNALDLDLLQRGDVV